MNLFDYFDRAIDECLCVCVCVSSVCLCLRVCLRVRAKSYVQLGGHLIAGRAGRAGRPIAACREAGRPCARLVADAMALLIHSLPLAVDARAREQARARVVLWFDSAVLARVRVRSAVAGCGHICHDHACLLACLPARPPACSPACLTARPPARQPASLPRSRAPNARFSSKRNLIEL